MVSAADHTGHPQTCPVSQSPRVATRPAFHSAGGSSPPPVVHEQLAVHLLVVPGGLHGVQQLLGLDELWVPFSVFWPGHQASDVGPLPLDLRVHGGCGNNTAGTGELVR